MIHIAVDGPSGAGKSTISRRVAERLGYVYVDTGALYRTIGLHALRAGIDLKDQAAIAAALPGLSVSLRFLDGAQHVLLGGEDVSEAIRMPDVSLAASAVSAVPAVRAYLFDLQRDIAAKNNCIMDGRDIGTVVLPDAQVKIFLTASPEERARRRYEELKSKGVDAVYETVLAELIRRDEQDSHREIAPLRPAQDAVLVDTTGNTLEQSIAQLTRVIKERLA